MIILGRTWFPHILNHIFYVAERKCTVSISLPILCRGLTRCLLMLLSVLRMYDFIWYFLKKSSINVIPRSRKYIFFNQHVMMTSLYVAIYNVHNSRGKNDNKYHRKYLNG